MKTLIYFDTEEDLLKITGVSDRQVLWDIGLCLDDWDYGVLFEGWVSEAEKRKHDLDRLLSGVCSNDWRNVETPDGKKFTIGMAFHA